MRKRVGVMTAATLLVIAVVTMAWSGLVKAWHGTFHATADCVSWSVVTDDLYSPATAVVVYTPAEAGFWAEGQTEISGNVSVTWTDSTDTDTDNPWKAVRPAVCKDTTSSSSSTSTTSTTTTTTTTAPPETSSTTTSTTSTSVESEPPVTMPSTTAPPETTVPDTAPPLPEMPGGVPPVVRQPSAEITLIPSCDEQQVSGIVFLDRDGVEGTFMLWAIVDITPITGDVFAFGDVAWGDRDFYVKDPGGNIIPTKVTVGAPEWGQCQQSEAPVPTTAPVQPPALLPMTE